MFEGNLHSFRQIFLNRDHPKDLNPTWWGDSVGKWEGDELVVDTVGFNGLTWLDLAGHGTSDQLHVIERYSRPDYGDLKDEITIEDPVYYTRPWKVTEWTPLITDSDLWEYICTENERDSRHLDNLIRTEQETKAKAKIAFGRLERARDPHRPRRGTGYEHSADSRHEPRRGHHARAHRRE